MLANVGQAPTVRDARATKLKAVKSGVIARAVAAGEPAVCGVVDQAAHYLASASPTASTCSARDVVVLGGGLVEKLGGRFVKQVGRSLQQHALEATARGVHVVPAQLGDAAAIHGAVGALRGDAGRDRLMPLTAAKPGAAGA